MALIVRGMSVCKFCGRTIQNGEQVELFPPNLFDPDRPESVLNDAGVHQACLSDQQFAETARERVRAYVAALNSTETP